MVTGIYLAMTAAEFYAATALPPKIGWMACHFSPYGRGLSNLPSSLPADSLLILNNRIPFFEHDPEIIADQLQQTVEHLHCAGILLDFEGPENPNLNILAQHLVTSLSCPIALSAGKVCSEDCAVFLPPCPHHTPLAEHIAPWAGRELWLDLAVDAETLTLTKDGSVIFPLPLGECPENGHKDSSLHCHYQTETGENFARFTLWRTQEDLQELAQEARSLGVKTLIGLYQEWL